MVCMVEPRIRERVIDAIGERAPLPTELVELLSADMSYREVQDVLSELLESGQVVLDSDLHLRSNRVAA
jgi:predicted kinase